MWFRGIHDKRTGIVISATIKRIRRRSSEDDASDDSES
jgi:hypothetical protein